MQKPVILVADDHKFFRLGLRSLILSSNLADTIYEATNGIEALRLLEVHSVDIVLLDVEMQGMGGLETATILTRRYPNVKIIVVTMHDADCLVLSFIKIGVHGFMLKEDGNLNEAIHFVLTGRFYYTKSLERVIVKAQKSFSQIKPILLSSRENRLIQLMAQGKSSEEIAVAMELSKHTVDTYRKNLLTKFDVSNSVELVDLAHRTGFL